MPTPRAVPPACRLFAFLLALLALPLLACQGCTSGVPAASEPPATDSPSADDPPAAEIVVALRPLGDSAELREYAEALAGDVQRWTEGRRLVVLEDGEEVPGEAEALVVAALLPLADGGLADGLPVDLSGASPVVDGETYDAPEVAVALRLPGDGTPRWLVAGRDPRSVAWLAGEALFHRFGFRSDGWEDSTDYMVRQASWRRRAGRWRDGRAVDTRNDFAAAGEWFEALERHQAGGVALLAPAGLPDAELLAAAMTEAVSRLAPRVPLDAAADEIRVAVEDDYPSMIGHTGDVGLAVGGGPADVHLVVDGCCDAFAYLHAVARVLVERQPELPPLPPYLREGAALWLSEHWFGRPWRDWLPRLAAADVLPTAEELLAAEEPPDGSRPLWTPVAAAVVDALPGATLAEKLVRVPSSAEVEARLAAMARLADSDPPPPPVREGGVRPLPPFLAGVSLAMLNHVELGYHAPSVGRAMDHLAATVGADAVSLMPFAFQAEADAPEMRYLNRSPGSETDVSMLHAARRARERGLTVLWKPQIWLRRSWPGEIEMTGDADWAAWFRAYRRFVVHQALLAEHAGADLFSVGVELGRTLGREAEWRRLIDAVGLFYAGPLTYSANWYGDFERVPFWERLDLLGIDAYQPLSDSPEASEEELRAGARRVVAGLAAAAAEQGKGIVVTELGYAAHEAAWTAPHEEGGPYSEADQATAYRVMLDELGRPGWLRGVFVWKAFSSDPMGFERRRRGGVNERADFRFLGREAEEVIARYYGTR